MSDPDNKGVCVDLCHKLMQFLNCEKQKKHVRGDELLHLLRKRAKFTVLMSLSLCLSLQNGSSKFTVFYLCKKFIRLEIKAFGLIFLE